MALPSSQRSLEEVIQCAFIARALGRPAESFLEDLRLGDAYHKSDIAFRIGDIVLVYEHDPGYWHPAERDDQGKTQKLLDIPNTLVVRGRIGASKMPMEHPRFIQLLLPERAKYREVLHAFLHHVAAYLPNHPMHPVDAEKEIITFAKEIFTRIHPDYETKVRERTELLQEYGLDGIVNAKSLVGMPLATLSKTICVLKEELRLSSSNIATNAYLLSKIQKLYAMQDFSRRWGSRLRRLLQTPVYSVRIQKLCNAMQDFSRRWGSRLPRLLHTPLYSGGVQNTCNAMQAFSGDGALVFQDCYTYAFLLGRDPDTLQRNARLLKEMGLSSSKIATCALLGKIQTLCNAMQDFSRRWGSRLPRLQLVPLLGRDPETLQRNARLLKEMGLSSSKIATYANLLCMNPDTLQRNARLLQEMGLSSSKIATYASLLGRDPDTLQRNASLLKEMGLSSKQIATAATLLGRDPQTLQRNARWFEAHDMEWRTDVLLLAKSTKRIESALKFLTEDCGIPRKLLSTRTITRFNDEDRKKIVWASFASSSTSEKCSIIRKLRRR